MVNLKVESATKHLLQYGELAAYMLNCRPKESFYLLADAVSVYKRL